MARIQTGDIDGALCDFDEAIRLESDDPVSYCSRGDAHRKKGDLDAALADYDQALRLRPDAIFYNQRGFARLISPDVAGALRDFDEAIYMGSDEPEAYYNRADAQEMLGRYRLAIQDYQTYLDLGGAEREGDRSETEAKIRDLQRKLFNPPRGQLTLLRQEDEPQKTPDS